MAQKKTRHNAVKIVSDALLGLDFKTVRVAGKQYQIDPPTIYRLAGAARALTPVAEARTPLELFTDARNLEAIPEALSWLIQGDTGLREELSRGTAEELARAVEEAYKLIDVRPFLRLSTSAESVGRTIARAKP